VNFVTTAKARNAIRAYLKNLKSDEARKLGRRLLEQALRPFDLSNRKLRKRWIENVLTELGEQDLDRVYEQLGLGERLAPVVAALLAQQKGGDQDLAKRDRKPLQIAGTEGLVVSYARCCNPIPGDEIIGFLSSGLGVVIHRTNCPNVADFRKHPTKWIPVEWQRGIKGEFQSEIQVRTMNRVGLLAEVAGRISAIKSNIDHVTVETDGDASTLLFRLKVRDRRHLAQVLRSIRTNPDVLRVQRPAG
jgi:(p)ppGpp synthase/HD superfamily hydrolase